MLRLLAASITAALAFTGIAFAPSAQALSPDTLTVDRSYNGGSAILTVNSFEPTDARPQYGLALTDLSTGAPVTLNVGYATRLPGGSYESNYTVTTTSDLTIGHAYEAFLQITRLGYWSCSVNNPNGCTYIDPSTDKQTWRFTYTGAKLTATPYAAPTPPAPVASETSVKLSAKKASGKRGWKINATLRSSTASVGKVKLIGEYKAAGMWFKDETYTTDKRGRAHITFAGEKGRTLYRLVFKGTSLLMPSTSASFSITQR